MKYFLFVLFIASCLAAAAQKKTSSLTLTGGVKLTAEIERFHPARHKTDTCRDEFSNKYICRIDGKKWYGTDQGMELPVNQLNKLTIYLRHKAIALNVSGLFNPAFSYELAPRQFVLKKKGQAYFLYGYFSDGAGTYTVHWKISNGQSTRLKISTDEEDFSWQF